MKLTEHDIRMFSSLSAGGAAKGLQDFFGRLREENLKTLIVASEATFQQVQGRVQVIDDILATINSASKTSLGK